MLRCALSCRELNSVDFASLRRDSSLSLLSELSMRISDHHIIPNFSVKKTQEPKVDGLRSLLRTCTSIQTLDLAHFSKVIVKRSNVQHDRIFRALGESKLRCLRCLTLQGFRVTEYELLACLRSFETLRSLSLRYMCLTIGRFKPIFDHCTMEAGMERLELDHLFETLKRGSAASRIITFDPPWVVQRSVEICYNGQGHRRKPVHYPRLPSSRALYRRASSDAKDQQIEYSFKPRPYTMDAVYSEAFHQAMNNRFGPVSHKGYPSCLQPYVRPKNAWRCKLP